MKAVKKFLALFILTRILQNPPITIIQDIPYAPVRWCIDMWKLATLVLEYVQVNTWQRQLWSTI